MRALGKFALLAGIAAFGMSAGAAYADSSPNSSFWGPDYYNSRLTVQTAAGVTDFTGSLGDHTNPGAGWAVRGQYDLNKNVGVEVGYLGAVNGIDDTRLPSATSITTTAFNSDLRLIAPFTAGPVLFKPYVFGGVGGAYYGVSQNSPLYASDSDLQFPLGAGGDAFLSHNISIGARFDYLINAANRIGTDQNGGQFGLTGNVGFHY